MIAYLFHKYPENFAFQLFNYNFAVIYPWNLYLKLAYFSTVSIVCSMYKQNFTTQ